MVPPPRIFYAPAVPTLLHGNAVPIEPIQIENEMTWLRHSVVRMRTILRFAKDPRTETGIRELIADAETRLAALATALG